MSKKTKKQCGQGLLETIIAIGIISVGMFAILALGIAQLTTSHDVEERLIASELAREGVEVVRAMRDSAWLEGVPWVWHRGTDASSEIKWRDGAWVTLVTMTTVPLFDPQFGSWTIDPTFLVRAGDASVDVYQDPNGLYLQQRSTPPPGWRKTKFQRLITLENTLQDGGTRVAVQVRWGDDPKQSMTIEQVLWDWK